MRPSAQWRKSSYSGSTNNCVEIARLPRGDLVVRDSKAPAAGVLCFGPSAWRSFVAALKQGELTG